MHWCSKSSPSTSRKERGGLGHGSTERIAFTRTKTKYVRKLAQLNARRVGVLTNYEYTLIQNVGVVACFIKYLTFKHISALFVSRIGMFIARLPGTAERTRRSHLPSCCFVPGAVLWDAPARSSFGRWRVVARRFGTSFAEAQAAWPGPRMAQNPSIRPRPAASVRSCIRRLLRGAPPLHASELVA